MIVFRQATAEPNANFRVIAVTFVRGELSNSFTLTWASELGKLYGIESSETGEEWTDLDLTIEGEEGTTSFTQEGFAHEDRRTLYRVLELGAEEE